MTNGGRNNGTETRRLVIPQRAVAGDYGMPEIYLRRVVL